MSTKKYRPYFTLAELEYLTKLVASDTKTTNLNLYSYLHKYVSDIKQGHRESNHILKPTMPEKLGFSAPSQDIQVRDIPTLLNIYTINQSYIGMNTKEIETLKEYRYSNDLMSPEEESSHEYDLMRGD